MRKFLLILSLLACVALSGCGSGDSNKSSSADDSIKGNVEIRDEKEAFLSLPTTFLLYRPVLIIQSLM